LSQRPTLIVFVKAPRLGQVKSRLAADIGAVEATQFYRHATADLLRRLMPDRRWRSILAVTPDKDAGASFWPMELPRMRQGNGDLGERMARCMAAVPPGPVVLVGTGVRWSTEYAVADTRANLGPGHRATLVDVLDDIDEGAAYQRWRLRRRPRADYVKS
jgi:hypothetical protein